MIFHRDKLDNVVCNIRTPNSVGLAGGTAIFVAKNGTEAYLLTAAHVVADINVKTNVIMKGINGNPIEVSLSTLLGGGTFEFHPLADLAKARINVTTSNRHFLSDRFFPYDNIDFSNNLLSKDVELTTVGFPLGLGASGAKFSPLSFRTYAAASALTMKRADNQNVCDFIILELPSVGGYSGGPVFDLGYMITGQISQSKEKTILHGIVHGTISDPTGGKLGAITPTKYLIDWL